MGKEYTIIIEWANSNNPRFTPFITKKIKPEKNGDFAIRFKDHNFNPLPTGKTMLRFRCFRDNKEVATPIKRVIEIKSSGTTPPEGQATEKVPGLPLEIIEPKEDDGFKDISELNVKAMINPTGFTGEYDFYVFVNQENSEMKYRKVFKVTKNDLDQDGVFKFNILEKAQFSESKWGKMLDVPPVSGRVKLHFVAKDLGNGKETNFVNRHVNIKEVHPDAKPQESETLQLEQPEEKTYASWGDVNLSGTLLKYDPNSNYRLLVNVTNTVNKLSKEKVHITLPASLKDISENGKFAMPILQAGAMINKYTQEEVQHTNLTGEFEIEVYSVNENTDTETNTVKRKIVVTNANTQIIDDFEVLGEKEVKTKNVFDWKPKFFSRIFRGGRIFIRLTPKDTTQEPIVCEVPIGEEDMKEPGVYEIDFLKKLSALKWNGVKIDMSKLPQIKGDFDVELWLNDAILHILSEVKKKFLRIFDGDPDFLKFEILQPSADRKTPATAFNNDVKVVFKTDGSGKYLLTTSY